MIRYLLIIMGVLLGVLLATSPAAGEDDTKGEQKLVWVCHAIPVQADNMCDGWGLGITRKIAYSKAIAACEDCPADKCIVQSCNKLTKDK